MMLEREEFLTAIHDLKLILVEIKEQLGLQNGRLRKTEIDIARIKVFWGMVSGGFALLWTGILAYLWRP